MKSRYQNRIELLQGTLDLLVLQTLQWGPQHGYGMTPEQFESAALIVFRGDDRGSIDLQRHSHPP